MIFVLAMINEGMGPLTILLRIFYKCNIIIIIINNIIWFETFYMPAWKKDDRGRINLEGKKEEAERY